MNVDGSPRCGLVSWLILNKSVHAASWPDRHAAKTPFQMSDSDCPYIFLTANKQRPRVPHVIHPFEASMMICLEDCIAMCDLEPEGVAAICGHERIGEVPAAALANYLLHQAHGAERIRTMIIEDIHQIKHAAELITVCCAISCSITPKQRWVWRPKRRSQWPKRRGHK